MCNTSHSPIQNLPTNMKILISILLLTIAIFQHFDELDAAEPGEGSYTGERRGRGRPRGSVANQNQYRVADPNDGPAHRRVYYGQIEIQVWLDGPSVRKAIFPQNYIPPGAYYRNRNFLIRTLERGDVTLVAYIGYSEELIGVRAPDPRGQKYKLEPTSSVWYINYIATHFKVNVVNSVPTAISLMPLNLHTPRDGSWVDTVGGITFRVFREYGTRTIDGAELVSYAFTNA